MRFRASLAALVAAVAVVCPAQATVTSTSNTVTYVGNAVTTSFTVPFKFLANTDLVVTVGGAAKALNVDYTVTGAGNATGTVKFTSAPPNLAAVVITRVVDYTQKTSLAQNRTPDPHTVESALDKLTMGEQQLQALFTNPPATVLPANVTAKLNGVRFADQFATIQAAITDAGTTGAVVIPPGYAGTDTFTNPNGIPILDLRGGPSRWRGMPSVKDFGAADDCTTDAAPAFVAALAISKIVLVPDPATCYKLNSQITIPANTRLIGVNKRTTKLLHGFNGDMFILSDGAGLTDLYLEGNGGTNTGRGLVMNGTAGRQSVHRVRVINFNGNPIEFAPMAGSTSSFIDVEAWQTGGTTGTNKYAIVIPTSPTGSAQAGATTTTISVTLTDTTHTSGYYDGAAVQFTSGTQSGTTRAITTSTTSGGGNWVLTVAAFPGAPANGDTLTLLVNAAVPRKFAHIETGGNCSFDFGMSNDVFVTASFLGDLRYTTQTRGVQLHGSRIANQVALNFGGFNNSIVGSDVAPQITILAGTGESILKDNIYNQVPVIDNSGLGSRNLVDTQGLGYIPVWTTGGTAPAIGNGTLRGLYSRIGAAVQVTIEIAIGSTTTVGTSEFRLSLPLTPVQTGTGTPGIPNGIQQHVGSGYCRQAATSTVAFIAATVATGTGYVTMLQSGTAGNVTGASPWVPANGDVCRLSLTYTP